MKIKKIEISNFKSIRDLSIDVSSGLNLIIGKNNSGKTTILEALLLWKKCYDNSITVNKYKFYSKPKYVNFSDLNFIRITDDSDLFNSTKGKKAECKINVVLEIDGDDCSLGFTISKVSNVHNAYYQLSYLNPVEFVKFEHFAKKSQTNLSSIIAMSESKPISNIIPQEPYMYKAQIKSKIKKGKGYEVLRNKIVNFDVDTSKIQMYISNVLGENYEFVEKEKENKEYIKLLVSSNGKQADILSQGSGFLQVAEIFSSLEFMSARLHVLLIDEPDSHIHFMSQKKLVDQLKMLQNSQLFIVSHNDRFIESLDEKEILFLNNKDKESGVLKPLPLGSKRLVIEDLVGSFSDLDNLRLCKSILVVEGSDDKKRMQYIIKQFCKLNGKDETSVYIIMLNGIDTLIAKLKPIFDNFSLIAQKGIKWIVLRDSDCLPQVHHENIIKIISNCICQKEKEVLFQNGYEFESVLFADNDFLIRKIEGYYDAQNTLSEDYINSIKEFILVASRDVTTQTYKTLSENFGRQLASRPELNNLKGLDYVSFVSSIQLDTAHYLMSKRIIDDFLSQVHNYIAISKDVTKIECLDSQKFVNFYLSSIIDINDIHPFHIEIMKKIFS